jgi:hypothetical protein
MDRGAFGSSAAALCRFEQVGRGPWQGVTLDVTWPVAATLSHPDCTCHAPEVPGRYGVRTCPYGIIDPINCGTDSSPDCEAGRRSTSQIVTFKHHQQTS